MGGVDLTCIFTILISVHNSCLGNEIIALITYKTLCVKYEVLVYPLNCQRFFSSSFCVFIHFVEFALHLRATRNLSTNFNSSICFLHMCKTLYDMKNSSVQWLFVQITGYLVSLIAIANKSYITIVHKCNYHDNIYYAVPSYPL